MMTRKEIDTFIATLRKTMLNARSSEATWYRDAIETELTDGMWRNFVPGPFIEVKIKIDLRQKEKARPAKRKKVNR